MEANGRSTGRGGPGVWGIMTLVIAVLTVGLCGWYALIFVNPYSPLNPLPPATVTPYPILDGPTLTPGEATAQPTPADAEPATPNPTAPQSAVATLTPPPGATQPAGTQPAGTPTQTTDLGQPSPTAGAQATTAPGDTAVPSPTTGSDGGYPIATLAPTEGYPGE